MAEMTVPLVSRGNGRWGSPSPAWDHLINRESGGIPDIIQQIHDVNSGGNEAEGLFQITPKTWQGHNGTDFAPSARRATPQQQAIVAARILATDPGAWGFYRHPGREDPRQLAAGLTPLDSNQPSQEPTVPDNRPDFNEVNQIGYDAANPHGSVRSRPPINFFIHTQEGDGNATDLAAYLRSTSGNAAVSYHYTIREDTNDHGVTVVDVIDTDLYAWAVLNANVFSINLCFAGSRAAWTRDQWLQQSRAIDVAAYLAVQDCKKYKMPTEVLAPPYAGAARGGISDHKYVTQKLGIGNHTDVGDNFPWDVFAAAVKKYVEADLSPVVTPPVVPPSAPPPKPVGPADDQITLRWNALGGQTVVEALAEVRDKVLGTNDHTKTGAR
jgi:hypothetical protein